MLFRSYFLKILKNNQLEHYEKKFKRDLWPYGIAL